MDPITRKRTSSKTITSQSEGLRKYINSVFAHMSIGLFLTAVIAYALTFSPELMRAIFGTPLRFVFLFAPLGIAVYFSVRIQTLSKEAATALFYTYAALIGVTTSGIFLIYSLPSIAQTFLTTATLFGVMSIYGYVTQTDLTKFGSFLIMGLFGLIISSIINMFMQSSGMQFILSIVGALIFIGLTAYDVQRIKAIYSEMDDSDVSSKKAIFGALILYLDFINLFFMLLQIMGQKNRR